MSSKPKITMFYLLNKAPLLLLGRLEVLFLLALLNGIITGVVLFPLSQALQPIADQSEVDVSQIADSIGGQLPLMVLTILFINSALLIPITRLLVDSAPFEGGLKKYLIRFSRIFALQISAVALFLLFLLVSSVILGILSAIIPQQLIVLIAIATIVIALLCIFTVTHVAIVGEAIDSRTSLPIAWAMIRPLLFPLAAAFGVIKITSLLLSGLLTFLLGGLVTSFGMPWLPTMIDQTISFAAQILHFAACLWATQSILKQRNGSSE